MRRLGRAGVVAALFVLAACENPLVVEMQQQIDQEVAVQELGNLSVSSVTPADGDEGVPVTTVVTIEFSQRMAAESLSAAVTVRTGDGTEVSGTATYDAEENTLTFAPDSVLAPATTYTVVLAADTLESAVGLTLSQNFTYQFTTREAATVSSVSPSENATGVGLTSSVTVTFSRAMDGESLTTDAFAVSTSGAAIEATVSYDEETRQATFTPDSALTPGVTYQVAITSDEIIDADGVALGAGKTWEFTTSARPVVQSVSPSDGEANAPINSSIVVIFDRPMDADAAEAAVGLATSGGDVVSGTATYEYDDVNYKVTFVPDAAFTAGTTYVIAVAGSAESAAGVALGSDASYSFTASPRPVVESLSPTDAATDTALDSTVVVTFDRAMDAASAEAAVSLAVQGGAAVSGTTAYDDTGGVYTVTLTPDAALDPNTVYDVTVASTAQSATGATFGTDETYSFTTIYYGSDEIGIDFTYTGTLEVSADRPVYVFAYVLPLPTDVGSNPGLYSAVLTGTPITSNGTYALSGDELPGDADAYLLQLIHDLNGSYSTDDDTDDNSDVHHWIKVGDPDTTIDTESDTPIERDGDGVAVIENDNFVIKPEYQVPTGSELVLDFFNESPYAADAFEDDDNGAYRSLSIGTPEDARNLHSLSDVDYFQFTTGPYDHYDIRIEATSFTSEVTLYESESDMVTGSGALAFSEGTSGRVINTNWRRLDPSTTYYLSVSSPGGGLGNYEIGYELRPVPNESPAVAYEPIEDRDSPTTLNFGRDNALTAVAGDKERDVYEIQVTDEVWYAIEVTENENYFGSTLDKRDIDFEITMYTDWTPGGPGAGIWTANSERFYEVSNGRVFFREQTDVEGGTGTRWIVVENESSTQGDSGARPTAEYTVALTWGPDNSDKAYDTTEGGPISDDATDTDFINSPYRSLYYPGTEEQIRTIYSGDNGSDPGDDVDWFRLSTEGLGTEYKVIAKPAAGEDGIHVNVELYGSLGGADIVPDTGDGTQGSAQVWASDSQGRRGLSFTPYQMDDDFDYTDPEDKVFWLKVTRDGNVSGNPVAGRYSIIFDAGADDEDTSNPDTTISVPGTENGDYGIDETPWIGQPYSTDFSNRNQLEWNSSTDSYPYSVAVVGFAEERYWSIYRKDYDFSAEPDGTTDPSSDVDFFWMQFDDADGDDLNDLPRDDDSDGDADVTMYLSSEGNPGVPLKVTYWRLSDATWTSIRDNNEGHVITEGELGTATGSLTSSLDGSQYQIAQEIDGIVDGDVLIFKIERNASETGGAESGQYRFRIRDL